VTKLAVLAHGAIVVERTAYSKSSPRPDDVPVLLACFPSMLSMVEYLHQVSADSRVVGAEHVLRPDAESVAVEQPWGSGFLSGNQYGWSFPLCALTYCAHKIRIKQLQQHDISKHEEEANQGDHVRRKP